MYKKYLLLVSLILSQYAIGMEQKIKFHNYMKDIIGKEIGAGVLSEAIFKTDKTFLIGELVILKNDGDKWAYAMITFPTNKIIVDNEGTIKSISDKSEIGQLPSTPLIDGYFCEELSKKYNVSDIQKKTKFHNYMKDIIGKEIDAGVFNEAIFNKNSTFVIGELVIQQNNDEKWTYAMITFPTDKIVVDDKGAIKSISDKSKIGKLPSTPQIDGTICEELRKKLRSQ